MWHSKGFYSLRSGPFPWNMIITFTHVYKPCWLSNAIELCTKQTRNGACVTHPLAVYKTAQYSFILPTKMLVRMRYVQFTYFMGRVYSATYAAMHVNMETSCSCWIRNSKLLKSLDAWWQQTYQVNSIVLANERMLRATLIMEIYLVGLLPPSVPKSPI